MLTFCLDLAILVLLVEMNGGIVMNTIRQTFLKAFEIVAYTYEADYHCPSCAHKRFGAALVDEEKPPVDSEGNEVKPLFVSEVEETIHCGDCLQLVYDPF